MLLKKLSKARTGVLISERAESIGRIEVCRFIIRSSKLPFFLTKPFMQREQKMVYRTRMREKSSSGWSVALHRHSASLLRGLGIVLLCLFPSALCRQYNKDTGRQNKAIS